MSRMKAAAKGKKGMSEEQKQFLLEEGFEWEQDKLQWEFEEENEMKEIVIKVKIKKQNNIVCKIKSNDERNIYESETFYFQWQKDDYSDESDSFEEAYEKAETWVAKKVDKC